MDTNSLSSQNKHNAGDQAKCLPFPWRSFVPWISVILHGRRNQASLSFQWGPTSRSTCTVRGNPILIWQVLNRALSIEQRYTKASGSVGYRCNHDLTHRLLTDRRLQRDGITASTLSPHLIRLSPSRGPGSRLRLCDSDPGRVGVFAPTPANCVW